MRKFSNPSWCDWIHLLLISLSTKIDSSQVLLNLHLTFNSNVSSPTQCSKTALYQINFLLLLLKPLSHLRHIADAKIICDLLRYRKTISIYALVKFSGKSAHICLLKRGGTEIQTLRLNIQFQLLPKQVDCFFADARNSCLCRETYLN